MAKHSDQSELTIDLSHSSHPASNELLSTDRLGSSAHTLKTGLASIIIPVFNQVRFTKLCLHSIAQNTDYPYELIIVDNGSTDGTSQCLANVPNIRVIRNETNKGVPKANNQGISVSRGHYVVLLNNDTIVTPHWLSRMVRCAEREHSIGIVGPITNDMTMGVQGDENAKYTCIANLYAYSEERAKKFAENTYRCPTLPSFAWLVKRQVFDRIGLFDEAFSPGKADDDDFNVRALRADFDVVIAEDAFVHHFGGRTFKGTKLPESGISDRNTRLFHKKWGPSPYSDALLRRFRKLHVTDVVSVVLVTHNRPESLKRSVASVVNQTYPHFELVVVGDCEEDVSPVLSEFKDERIVNVQCKQRLGMAIARNMGLRRARGKYVAYLGEDDVYYPDHLESLVAALATTSFNVTYSTWRRILWQADTQGKRMTVQSGIIDRDYNKRRFLLVDYIPLTSVMHRRSLLDSIGLFHQDLFLYDDWDLLIRLAQSDFFYHSNRVTSEVNVARQALNPRCYRQRLNLAKKIHGKYRVTANLSRNARLSLAFGIQLMQLLGQQRIQRLLSFLHRVVMNDRHFELQLQTLSEISSVPEWSRGLRQ